MEVGKKVWVIAEGYIPKESTGPAPKFTSHETACILNAGDTKANIKIFIFFSDKEPVGPYEVSVAAKRTLHLRFNELKNPEIPLGTDYSSVLVSDQPVVVQHSRLDSRQSENALITTIAYSE